MSGPEKTREYYDGHLINFSSDTGYPTIWNGKENVLLHRYVWEKQFGKIPKGFNIHHKDRNKLNYDINNLELISVKNHHRKHAIENGLGKSNKGKTKNYISGFCKGRKEIIAIKDDEKLYFSSIYKASQELNIPHNKISRVLKNKAKTTRGWRFEYATS